MAGVRHLLLDERAAEGERRRRDRAARAGNAARPPPSASVQMPVATQLALGPEARALTQQPQSGRGRAQRARHHHQVAGRAPARRSSRSAWPSSVMSITIGPGVAERLPPTTFTPASAARSSSPS